ncbi:MAG: helicase, partial [Gemmatimonadales bacterium]|nr:helicase [Gemmatimonadales bacterium]
DSAQLALTGLDLFDASQVAAAGGGGFLTALSLVPLDEDLRDESVKAPAAGVGIAPEPQPAATDAAAESEKPSVSQPWEKVITLLDQEEPGLVQFARALAELGVRAPRDLGFELGDQAWQAEIAWPKTKIAIVLAGDDDEARKRDAAYTEAGWDVRAVPGWTPEELAELIGGTT